jgi:hypothetical protein
VTDLPPPPACPKDSTELRGKCVCLEGTHGTPGKCVPDQVIVKPLPI